MCWVSVTNLTYCILFEIVAIDLMFFRTIKFNPRLTNKVTPPPWYKGGGGLMEPPPWVFVMVQYFEKISPLVESP